MVSFGGFIPNALVGGILEFKAFQNVFVLFGVSAYPYSRPANLYQHIGVVEKLFYDSHKLVGGFGCSFFVLLAFCIYVEGFKSVECFREGFRYLFHFFGRPILIVDIIIRMKLYCQPVVFLF
nr:MAG TPA: hypothetical protein [Caudoviricetes sp.]